MSHEGRKGVTGNRDKMYAKQVTRGKKKGGTQKNVEKGGGVLHGNAQ